MLGAVLGVVRKSYLTITLAYTEGSKNNHGRAACIRCERSPKAFACRTGHDRKVTVNVDAGKAERSLTVIRNRNCLRRARWARHLLREI